MYPINQEILQTFISAHLANFQQARMQRLQDTDLRKLLKRKNLYLFKAEGIETPAALVSALLDARLSSSEETLFGAFLEEVAIHVAEQTSAGLKSSTRGIDLEFDRDQIRFIIAIKSGPHWGNSSQYQALRRNFQDAKRRLAQSTRVKHIQPVLGMCYGSPAFSDTGLYWKLTGQSFWYFLSGEEDFYLQLLIAIEGQAERHNLLFAENREHLYEQFIVAFAEEYADSDGSIDWPKLIQLNSGNDTDLLPLD